MVGADHGMNTSGYTIPYVSSWAARVDGKEPVEIVQATGERVRKTAAGILDQLDTIQVGDGTPPGLQTDPAARESMKQSAPAKAAATQAISRPMSEPVRVPAGRGLGGPAGQPSRPRWGGWSGPGREPPPAGRSRLAG